MNMRFFERRGEAGSFVDALEDSVHKFASEWSKGRVVKAGLIAGGLAALTAGSAGVSSLRRREEKTGSRS
jgi:hypothetical protein